MLAATPEPAAAIIGFYDFPKVDVRVGRVTRVEPSPDARKPACRLNMDVGPAIGVKRSSAQVTRHYGLVAAIIDFPPRQIGPMMSEVLTLGFPDAEGEVVLVGVDREAVVGGRLF